MLDDFDADQDSTTEIPNPSTSTVTIEFSLSQASFADVSVFDITGRLVGEIRQDFPQGQGEVVISDLQPGIYSVRMTSEDFTAIQRFVVIE